MAPVQSGTSKGFGRRALDTTGGRQLRILHRTGADSQMERVLTGGLLLGIVLALWARVAPAQDVTIIPDGQGFRVKTPVYEAAVDADGCFPSLQVNGVEFLKSAQHFPRGAYFYQDGLLRLQKVEQEAPDTLTAMSDLASAKYQFSAESMKWTLSNLTPKAMLLVIVFDPAVSAMRDEWGQFEKTPVDMPIRKSTWFREGAKVHIEGSTRLWGPWEQRCAMPKRPFGSTRLWGPWAKNHQVWESRLGPKETREVIFQMGKATDEETSQAREAMARVIVPPADPVGPMWDLEALSRSPAVYPAEGFEAKGVKAIFYEGLPFRGKPTRVFAWLGVPKVEPGEKVPGMVLVHGGGGTAFAEWVRLWTGRGYAAIAMDTCGCVPKGSYGAWERHPQGGPPGWGGFSQIDWPREDQWTYHAVADVLLAHSLLRSLPEVDPERTGVTGISWGGYLTCIVVGVDSRFKLAVPVYGCGYYLDTSFASSVEGLGGERTRRWMRWWDPSAYLKDATMPMLWVTGSNDFAYTFPALQKSYRDPKGPRTLCIRLRMPHGHGGAGENPEEIHVFANSILKGGVPLARITGQGRDGRTAWVTYESMVPVIKAELNVTKMTGKWPDRLWEALPAEVDGQGKVTATLPDDVTAYYFNLIDDRNLVVSSEHVEPGS